MQTSANKHETDVNERETSMDKHNRAQLRADTGEAAELADGPIKAQMSMDKHERARTKRTNKQDRV